MDETTVLDERAPKRSHRTRWARLVALLASLALLAAACGGGRDDDEGAGGGGNGGGEGNGESNGEEVALIDTSNCPDGFETVGIEGDTIKLGTSLPQSGLTAAFAQILRGERAYFEYVNQELGGVEVAGQKYKIQLVDKNDEYDPARTAQNVTELVETDNVFALFNVVGTSGNLAIRDYLNEQCVPDLFAATGAPQWGNRDFPWLVGAMLVPYSLEAKAFVDYLQENKPDATVAILRASDDFGRAYSDTFKSLIEGTDITVVAEESYNPEDMEVGAQMTSLAAKKADALLAATTLLACPETLKSAAAAGWEPIAYVSGTCLSKTLVGLAGAAADGMLSAANILDPQNPANDTNEAMALYKEKVPQYASDADVTNSIVAYGWTQAAVLVELLERSPELTRSAVMETARTLESIEGVALMMPGVSLSTSEDDWFLGEQFKLVQYSVDGGFFAEISDVVELDGQTADVTPDSLLNG